MTLKTRVMMLKTQLLHHRNNITNLVTVRYINLYNRVHIYIYLWMDESQMWMKKPIRKAVNHLEMSRIII